MSDLVKAIERARKRLCLSKIEYAARVGLSKQGLAWLYRTGGVSGATLARLQKKGGLRVTRKLIASLEDRAAA